MKILLIENWGLGDAVIMTAAIKYLLECGYDLTVLCKPASAELLQPSYPDCKYIVFNWPWTAFTHKYRFWKWPWRKIAQLLHELHNNRFHAALSVRPDPRDHLIMFLTGAQQRLSYRRCGSSLFLTDAFHPEPERHRVDDWLLLTARLKEKNTLQPEPQLNSSAYNNQNLLDENEAGSSPWLLIHCGAGQPVRCWPQNYYAEIAARIKAKYLCRLCVVYDAPPLDQQLTELADKTFISPTINDLVVIAGKVKALLANDSGPGHIAAALGTPVCSFFGPQNPALFRPYGKGHLVIEGSSCRHKPCRDYCRFPSAQCLTGITPDQAWPEINQWLSKLFQSQ